MNITNAAQLRNLLLDGNGKIKEEYDTERTGKGKLSENEMKAALFGHTVNGQKVVVKNGDKFEWVKDGAGYVYGNMRYLNDDDGYDDVGVGVADLQDDQGINAALDDLSNDKPLSRKVSYLYFWKRDADNSQSRYHTGGDLKNRATSAIVDGFTGNPLTGSFAYMGRTIWNKLFK